MPPSDRNPLNMRSGPALACAQAGPYWMNVPLLLPQSSNLLLSQGWPISMMLPSGPLSDRNMMSVSSWSPVVLRYPISFPMLASMCSTMAA